MVTPKTQAQAPQRSLDQRMEALKRANDIRVRRAQLKKDLKDGSVQIEQVLRRPPAYVETAKVFDILMAVPEVRAGQGGQAAQPVPDQPVEDRRRPLGAPAGRADWALQPVVAGASGSSTDHAGPSAGTPANGRRLGASETSHRPRGLRITGPSVRADPPAARRDDRGVGDDAPRRTSSTGATTGSSRTRSSTTSSATRACSSGSSTSGTATGRCARRSTASTRVAARRSSTSRSRVRCASATRCRAR